MKTVLAAIVLLAGLVPCFYVVGIWIYTASNVGIRQGIQELYPPGQQWQAIAATVVFLAEGIQELYPPGQQWQAIAATVVFLAVGFGLIAIALSAMSPKE